MNGWIIPSVFACLCTLLTTLVLMYLKGIARDITDLRTRAEATETNWNKKLDDALEKMRTQAELQGKEARAQSDAQTKEINEIKVSLAKLQEQMYSILRGAGREPLAAVKL